MRVFLTGGTGFVGGAVARKLVAAGHHVRALVRRGSNTRQLQDLPLEQIEGDLLDATSLEQATRGCDWVFHVAALYSFWGYPWETFYQTNVEGTRRMLQAAGDAGVSRIVYTSSIATLGLNPDKTPADENTPVSMADMIGSYKRSKFMAEEVARDFAKAGLPVVIVNPSAPVGVGDHKPTQTGKVIVDFLNGRMPAYVDTGLNLVDVEDVALGHLLAAEKGKTGECYILGGENITLKQMLDQLAEISGRPQVRLKIPHFVTFLWAFLDVTLARIFPNRIPSATPETARLSYRYEYFNPKKAIEELGFPQNPAYPALRKAVEWYRANGYAP
jgi:dihydroflavonol-4-reductase